MNMEKYGIETHEEGGYSFYWVTSIARGWFADDEPDREQVISAFEDSFDELAKRGYSAMDIHFFLDELNDVESGEKAYENLCANVSYLKRLEERALRMPESIRKPFLEFLWRWEREPKRYDDYVAVLPSGFDFMDLLAEEEDFKRKIGDCRSEWRFDYAEAIKLIVEEWDVSKYLTNVILGLSEKLDEKIRSAECEIVCIRRKFEELKGAEIDPEAEAAFERIRENIETIGKYRYADKNAGKK